MGTCEINNICNVLASGSSGNCEIYYKIVVVDMGITYKKIQPYLYDIKLILLSHVHS